MYQEKQSKHNLSTFTPIKTEIRSSHISASAYEVHTQQSSQQT